MIYHCDIVNRLLTKSRSSQSLVTGLSSFISIKKIYMYLFLFGIAMGEQIVLNTLGSDQVQTLQDARLLRVSPFSRQDEKYGTTNDRNNEVPLIVEYQIYLLPTNCFVEGLADRQSISNTWIDEFNYQLFFIIDWPLESLRLPRDAIMAVGYDILEWMALLSGTELFRRENGDDSPKSIPHECKLVCMDILSWGTFA